MLIVEIGRYSLKYRGRRGRGCTREVMKGIKGIKGKGVRGSILGFHNPKNARGAADSLGVSADFSATLEGTGCGVAAGVDDDEGGGAVGLVLRGTVILCSTMYLHIS